mgnify:CR=1 FL=1
MGDRKIALRKGRKFNGYTPQEILQIEKVFLDACGFKTPLCHYNKKPENPTANDRLLIENIEFTIDPNDDNYILGF